MKSAVPCSTSVLGVWPNSPDASIAVGDVGHLGSFSTWECFHFADAVEEIVYSLEMKHAMLLSLTPPEEGAGAAAPSLGVVYSPPSSRRSSLCDNIEEITIKSHRASDLYRFTQDLVQK